MKNNLNYIFKRVITFFIIFVLLSFIKSCEVKAETIQVNYNKVKINDSTWFTQYGYYGMSFSTSGTSFNFELEQYDGDYTNQQYGETPEQFTMVAIDFCFGSSINKLERANNYGDSCPNSCFTQTPFYVYMNSTCKYNNTDTGFLYRLYFPILKWEAVPSTNLDLWRIKDKMKITPTGYNTTGTFTNVYLTTELPIPDSIDAINAQISSLNSTNHQDSINTQNAINNASSQAHQDSQNTQNAINNQTNTIKDDSVDSADSKASEWASKNLSDNAVANMVTMPITLLQAYLNGLNGSCSSFSLGTLYDHELTLPCINLSSYFGSTLWGVIDILFSGFMIYAIGKKFVKIFNDFTNLKDNQVDELYGGGN